MTVTVVNKYKEPNHIYCGRGSFHKLQEMTDEPK